MSHLSLEISQAVSGNAMWTGNVHLFISTGTIFCEGVYWTGLGALIQPGWFCDWWFLFSLCVGGCLWFMLCSKDVRILWPGFLHSSFKWLKIIPGKSTHEGPTLEQVKRYHVEPTCTELCAYLCISLPAELPICFLSGHRAAVICQEQLSLERDAAGWSSFVFPLLGDLNTVPWLFSAGQQCWSVHCFPGELQESKTG